jgi:hypothetical protein
LNARSERSRGSRTFSSRPAFLAALIVDAAMLMRVETSWKVLGYPGLAIRFFLAAAPGRRPSASGAVLTADGRGRHLLPSLGP